MYVCIQRQLPFSILAVKVSDGEGQFDDDPCSLIDEEGEKEEQQEKAEQKKEEQEEGKQQEKAEQEEQEQEENGTRTKTVTGTGAVCRTG